MGSMYMGHVLLAGEGEQLITSSIMKYWPLAETHADHDKCQDARTCRPTYRYPNCVGLVRNNITDNGDNDDDDDYGNDDKDDEGREQETNNTRRRGMKVSSTTGDDGKKPSPIRQSFAKMDCATLARLGWTGCAPSLTSQHQDGGGRGQRSRSAPPKNAANVMLPTDSDNGDNSSRTNLTKEEYRRLTEQVRHVDSIIRNKFRRPGSATATTAHTASAASAASAAAAAAKLGIWNGSLKTLEMKLPKPGGGVVPLEATLRSQSCYTNDISSNRNGSNSSISSANASRNGSSWQGQQFQAARLPFHVRRWFPHPQPQPREGLLEPPSAAQRCPAPSSRPRTSRSASSQRYTTTRARQRSSPIRSLLEHPKGSRDSCAARGSPLRLSSSGASRLENSPLEDGDFHSLSPRLVARLLNESKRHRPAPPPYYGRGFSRIGSEEKRSGAHQSKESVNDDLSTTSGVESEGDEDGVKVSEEDDDDGDDDDDDDDNNAEDNDDSSDSDNEGFEPSLDDLIRQLPNPQNLFPLRPENLDAFDPPDDHKADEEREVDFDATHTNPPLYKFSSPLPDGLQNIDLRRCAQEKGSWRDGVKLSKALEPGVEVLMDRLVEIEKIQCRTEDWEARKTQKVRLRRQAKTLQNSNSGCRAASGRQRDRLIPCQCRGEQACCGGDCLEKRLSSSGRCSSCGQPGCSKGCCERKSRTQRHGQDSQVNGDHHHDRAALPPKSPSPVGARRSRMKPASANLAIPVRPKSSMPGGESRTKSASAGRQRETLRPVSAASVNSSLVRDLERLGFDVQPPVPANKPNHPRPGSPYHVLSDKTLKCHSKTSGTDGAATAKDKRKTRTGDALKVLRGSS